MLTYDAIVYDVELIHPDGTKFVVCFSMISRWQMGSIFPEPTSEQEEWLIPKAWKAIRKQFGADSLAQ